MKFMLTLTIFTALGTFVPQAFAQGYGVQAPEVEVIKSARLNDVEALPGYYKGALTDLLDKKLRTDKKLYGELVKSPELLKSLYSRRDLQDYLARDRITVEQLRTRFKPLIEARKEDREIFEKIQKRRENAPERRLQNQRIQYDRR